ncbi:hypothetical protein ANN_24936 [Periplaneta americana]|uniref:Uncharacterized protein n=1 Tax=Periplaneta americana TaxID=6978 RepID=A0ABQ8RZZ7_PERAM|nr:hypothetical protein ANN_24936 [Periplaneta americana]
MASLCEGGNEPSGSLKAIWKWGGVDDGAGISHRSSRHYRRNRGGDYWSGAYHCGGGVVILRRFISILGYLASERDEGDNAGKISPGSSTESYPAFAHIGLRENPRKKPQPESQNRDAVITDSLTDHCSY